MDCVWKEQDEEMDRMMNLTTLTLPDGVVIDGAVASGDYFGKFSEWKS